MNGISFFDNLKWVVDLVAISIILIFSGLILRKFALTIIGIIFLAILIFFFRNNLKPLPRNNNNFISPSSSKVTNIIDSETETKIYTYLSPLDRHFMIAPVDCTIKHIEFKPRDIGDAERLRVVFEDDMGREFILDQIVSKLGYGSWIIKLIYGRRCVVFNNVGDKLKQGQRYGLIRFGSSMQYNLPKDYTVNCQIGTHYQLGESLASL